MPRILKRSKRFLRKITCRQQKQQDMPPAVPSASITPVNPSATSPVPPAALSASVTPEDSAAIGTKHAEQQQYGNSLPPTNPISPAVPSASITPDDSAATGTKHIEKEQSGAPIPPAVLSDSITPENPSATSPIPPTAPSVSITPEESSATGIKHVEQEQSGDSLPSKTPIPPAVTSDSITPKESSATGTRHSEQKQSGDILPPTSSIPPIAPSASSTPEDSAVISIKHVEQEQSGDGLPSTVSTPPAAPSATGVKHIEQEQSGDSLPSTTPISPIAISASITPRITSTTSPVSPAVPSSGITPEDSAATGTKHAEQEQSRDSLPSTFSIPPATPSANNSPEDSAVKGTKHAEQEQSGDVHSFTSPANHQQSPAEQPLLGQAYNALAKENPGLVKGYDELLAKEQMPNSAPNETTSSQLPTPHDSVYDDLGQVNQLVIRQELEHLNKTSEDTHATLANCLSVAVQQLALQEDAKKERRLAEQEAQQGRLLAGERKCLQLFYLTQNGKGATYDWYKDRVELRVEGTCNWLLQHGSFREWLSQESGPLLVSADPGCGKSVLAKYLIDHELAQLSATICYFFFKEQDQNTIRQALCALLHQLFSQKTALIRHAMDLYNKLGDKLVQSEESLWSVLRDAVRDPQAGPVTFVIDALDECAASQLSSLMTNLKDIFCDQQRKNVKLKVLMTSRPYERVVSEFHSLQAVFPSIHIRGDEEFDSQEINSVIHHRVEQLAKTHRLSDKAKSSLASKLLAIEHRTYLWVHLVFDHLDEGFRNMEVGIDAAIQTLPETVNQAYNQILNRSLDNEIVKKALSIILAARRPLTLTEMNIAMTLNGQSRGRSIYDLALEQNVDFKTRLRTLCGLIVNVHDDRISFFHQTAREFLIQSSAPSTVSPGLQWHQSITTLHAHSVLAEVCMFYLDMLNSTHTETFCEDDQHGALVEYSVEHWGDHFREVEFEKGSAMVELAAGLCTPDLTSHSQWASIISSRYHIRPESYTNVLVASHLGLTPVTDLLLSRGANAEARDDDGMTALMLAAKSGHEAVMRLLLEKGADVNARNNDNKTALLLAVESGHEAVTRLLLDHGADVNVRNNDNKTALLLAVESGHEAVTQLLLEKGADANARNNDNKTALLLAVEFRHEATIRLLLNHGADVNVRNNDNKSSLLLAVDSGHEAIIRLLLEHGADVEARNNDGTTALMYAAGSGNEAVTRLLLDHGANIEVKDSRGWPAIRHATGTTRRLLLHGAQV